MNSFCNMHYDQYPLAYLSKRDAGKNRHYDWVPTVYDRHIGTISPSASSSSSVRLSVREKTTRDERRSSSGPH